MDNQKALLLIFHLMNMCLEFTLLFFVVGLCQLIRDYWAFIANSEAALSCLFFPYLQK